jgi:hypothetical protein
VHLGDLVDRRKYVNTYTAHRLREDFINPILNRNIAYHQIIGNHDCYFKNTNTINAPEQLFHEKFPIYTTAEEVIIHDKSILFVPWMCGENKEKSIETIQKSRSLICMGHLELQGFEMDKGNVSEHGDDRKIFDRFDLTLSGHYHHASNDGSVYYLGSHAQFTWSDYDDEKGFHILELDTLELQFIRNPYEMFSKMIFDGNYINAENINEITFENIDGVIHGSFVKLIVINKNDPHVFDLFCKKIESEQPLDLQIIEEHMNLDVQSDKNIIDQSETMVDIFRNYIKNINDTNVDKNRLNNFVIDLYNQAVNEKM